MNLLSEVYPQKEMVPMMYKVLRLGDNRISIQNGVDGGVDNDDENPYMLSTLAPRLWPFMRHSISSVRYIQQCELWRPEEWTFTIFRMVKSINGKVENNTCFGEDIGDLLNMDCVDFIIFMQHNSGFEADFEENSELLNGSTANGWETN
ncbi:btaf1 RNA polymerase II, B-TFIID transcription factor-associated, 170kDa [Stylosanthes scabra]|uniref:Btaf1 RNA polymerase II, B-TFIID transcription factor-associated, 170kDa n=1 Tax=Stylosanthes scabra TaxID=79078 RepID=A0ABU6SRD5_9FABA|nr:btaf1 RNA polymerase II, B-TFIID transcription factor-associated, 170kDa [Stylosanthes scabra]